MILMKKMKQ